MEKKEEEIRKKTYEENFKNAFIECSILIIILAISLLIVSPKLFFTKYISVQDIDAAIQNTRGYSILLFFIFGSIITLISFIFGIKKHLIDKFATLGFIILSFVLVCYLPILRWFESKCNVLLQVVSNWGKIHPYLYFLLFIILGRMISLVKYNNIEIDRKEMEEKKLESRKKEINKFANVVMEVTVYVILFFVIFLIGGKLPHRQTNGFMNFAINLTYGWSFVIFAIEAILITIISVLFNIRREKKDKIKVWLYIPLSIVIYATVLMPFGVIALFSIVMATEWLGNEPTMFFWPIIFIFLGWSISLGWGKNKK